MPLNRCGFWNHLPQCTIAMWMRTMRTSSQHRRVGDSGVRCPRAGARAGGKAAGRLGAVLRRSGASRGPPGIGGSVPEKERSGCAATSAFSAREGRGIKASPLERSRDVGSCRPIPAGRRTFNRSWLKFSEDWLGPLAVRAGARAALPNPPHTKVHSCDPTAHCSAPPPSPLALWDRVFEWGRDVVER